MNNKDCEVCARLIKEKYRYYKAWRNLAIVFICLTVLFAILYFASGDLFTSTTIEYNNEVQIENEGGNHTNTDNGNIIVEENNSSTGGVIVLSVLIITGGVLGGCYYISQASHKDKQ